MRAYSEDIRRRVLHATLNEGASHHEVALRFEVSMSFVRKLLKSYRDTGNIAAKRREGRKTIIPEADVEFVLHLLDQDPSRSLSDLCETLTLERHVRISRSTMWRLIKKHRPQKGKRRQGTNVTAPQKLELASPTVPIPSVTQGISPGTFK